MPKDAAVEEVEEFARLVRALKVRDGRSYEALGRRLNVSASSLHRYCTGGTVPEDFAVVDRLAVLCGADEAERRALAAAWARADGVRRPPVPEPVPEPEPVPVPEPELVPEPEPVHARVADVPSGLPSARRRGRRPGWRGLLVGGLSVVVAVTLGVVLLPGKPRERAAVPPAPAPAPVTWTVASHLWKNGCGHTYLMARTPPPPPETADARRWAAAQQAVDGGETLVRVSVQGKGAAAVVLQALHVRVAERGAALPWGAYRMGDGCGGAVTPRRFEVDLDRPRPLARALDGYDASGEQGRTLPAVAFPYAVSAAEPVELLVSARAAECDCRWYLELEWSSEGRRGTVRIGDEDGGPFRTSGAKGRPVYGYDSGRRAWITGEESGQGG
ncbi:helix-turn-helix domain-containing protein [Streptomyces sp. NPDC090025]|uniref:helix-turn-helix domain-containing protein n=1 Tax=Streptomyces sp. NPDC090025 TaxID=3365922 RepID=UPI003836487A